MSLVMARNGRTNTIKGIIIALTKCFLLLLVLFLSSVGMRQTREDLFLESRMGSLVSGRAALIGHLQQRVVRGGPDP